MNCSMCQEKLDERLDQLRARVQDGTMSRADVRAQGLVALQEVVGECQECESELREHLNVRLTLLSAAPASIAVPPALRANVRRALERESVSRSPFPSRRPWTSYAWTSGALLSALGLFLIARPLLIEKAQEPVVSSSDQAPAAVQEAHKSISPVPQPTRLPAAKSSVARPAKPTDPAASTQDSNSAPASASSPQPTQSLQPPSRTTLSPPVLAQSQAKAIVPPVPPTMPPASVKENAQQQKQADASSSRVATKRSSSAAMSARSNPLFSVPSMTSPTSQGPRASTSNGIAPSLSSGEEKANTGQPRLDTLAEPQLNHAALAPTGEKLGLVVRFSSPPLAVSGAMRPQSDVVGGFGGGVGEGLENRVNGSNAGGGFGGNASGRFAGNGFGGGASASARTRANKVEEPSSVSTLKAPPAPVAPSPAFAAPSLGNRQGRINAFEARPIAPAKPNRLADTITPQGTPSASDAVSAGSALRTPQSLAGAGAMVPNIGSSLKRLDRDAALPLTVSLSVANPVVGARVQGRIKGKMKEDILLWSGDLVANQPVSIPLVSLRVVAGDEVELSVEQQASLKQTRRLATASVVVP